MILLVQQLTLTAQLRVDSLAFSTRRPVAYPPIITAIQEIPRLAVQIHKHLLGMTMVFYFVPIMIQMILTILIHQVATVVMVMVMVMVMEVHQRQPIAVEQKNQPMTMATQLPYLVILLLIQNVPLTQTIKALVNVILNQITIMSVLHHPGPQLLQTVARFHRHVLVMPFFARYSINNITLNVLLHLSLMTVQIHSLVMVMRYFVLSLLVLINLNVSSRN